MGETRLRKRLLAWSGAVATVALAAFVRVALDPWLRNEISFGFFFLAVVLTAFYGGFGPALLASILATFAADYFVLEPHHTLLFFHGLGPTLALSLFFGISVVICVLGHLLQLNRERAVKAFEALEKSERLRRLSQEIASIGAFEWNLKTGVNTWTQELKSLYGLSQGDFPATQEGWEQLIHPDDRERAKRAVERAFVEETTVEEQWRVIWPDGSLHWLAGRFRIIRNKDGEPECLTGVNLDITFQQQEEEALRAAQLSAQRAKEAAEEASAAKDQFLAVLSHELRTPLTPVLAGIQILQRSGELSAKDLHNIDVIRRNVELEVRLIDDLLDLTRIVKGKLFLERKRVNICTALERVAEICRPDLEAKKLHFKIALKGAPLPVHADVSRLQQIFWNLLKNSIKFTPEGGCIGISGCRKDGRVVLEVRDSGVGIEPGVLPRLFNAFEQGEKGVNRQFGGLGLGLAITKRLVEMHDGTISAASAGKNQGSTFSLSFPELVSEAETDTETETEEKAHFSKANTSKHILLVEDHGDTAMMIRGLLEEFGYRVETACDARHALEAAQKDQFDLLISDLGLPDMSGLELMRELVQEKKAPKGIALSGFGREEDIRRSKEAGFVAHLTKPVAFDTLLSAVARVI